MPRNKVGKTMVEISTVTLIKFLLLCFAGYLLFLLKDIVLIIITAIVIASAIEPVNAWFERHHIDRIYSVVIVYLTSAILLFGAIYFFIPTVISQFSDVAAQFPSYISTIDATADADADGILANFRDLAPLDNLLGGVQSTAQTIIASPGGLFSAIFGGLLSFTFIVVISFYLAVQKDGVANFLRIITPRSYESYVINLWSRTRRKIAAWLQGQLILSLIVGTFSFIGLWIIGVPNALLLAVLAGVFELIPLFGPILAAIPAILIGFIAGGIEMGFLVAALYFVIQQLENHVFHPVVVRKVVGVPAIVVIISLLIGGQLAGFLGLLLAVPIAAGLMEFINDLEKYKGHPIAARFEAEAKKLQLKSR